jgi:hypothetical protein
MAKRTYTAADLDFPFGANVAPRRPKKGKAKGKKAAKGKRRGGAFGS